MLEKLQIIAGQKNIQALQNTESVIKALRRNMTSSICSSVWNLISEHILTIQLAQNLESYFVFAKTGHTGPYSEALDLSQGKTTVKRARG